MLFFFFLLLNYCSLLVVGESTASPLQLNHDQINIMVNLSKSLSTDSYYKWHTTEPNPCLWEWVACSSAGPSTAVVAGLSLYNLGISTAANGSNFFSILCRLDTLHYLDLSRNHMTTIPDSFFSNCTGLSGLKSLDLSYNYLTGPVRNFSNFASLETLDLSGNYLNGTVETQLSTLSKLKSLNLSLNLLSGTIPTLGIDGRRVAALEELVLWYNHFDGTIPGEIFEYENLTMLDLRGNSLSGTIPEKIGMLSKLTNLLLSSNQLTGKVPATLSNITTLFRFLADQNNLEVIIPSITKFLSVLDLSNNNFTGEIPFDLLASPNLEFAGLSNNRLEGPIPTNLSIGLRNLRLGGNLLSGVIPTSIGKLSQLEYLELNNNNLYSEIPIGMLKLESLYTLNLQHNKFYGSIPDSINGLKNLIEARLGSNYFNGSIPSSLGDLRYLQILDLSYNNFSGNVPDSLSLIDSLAELVLSYNNLSGDLPTFSSSVNVTTVGNKNLIIPKRSAESPSPGNDIFVVNDSSKRRKIAVALVVVSSFVAGFSVSFLVSSLTWKFLIRKKAADVQEEDDLSDLNNRKYLTSTARV